MDALPPDPWKVLGLDKTADKSEIRSTYRKLVLRCHPDKVQDPTLKAQKQDEFQKVHQAYELLLNDAERTKYEEQAKLAELRKQAAMMSKTMPNSSATRTPNKQYFTYEVRTAEPRFKSSPHHASNTPPQGSKFYSQHHATTRSWDDDVSPRTQATYDDERRARRAASYEQPSRRDDDKRDERRRRDREEERERERDRERREKDARRAEKKRADKERDRDRKRGQDEKHRNKSPYVEPYEEEVYSIKVEKKKSTSKKHDEPRDKSSSRRDRDRSPRHDGQKQKTENYLDYAANYIESSKSKSGGLNRPQAFQEPSFYDSAPVSVPTPPPAEFIDDDVRRSSARASGRRSSNETPYRIKEKTYQSRKKSSREDIDIIEAGSPRARLIPTLQKSHTTPPVVPESPPRPGRINTVPQDMYSRPPAAPPSFARTNTWAPGEDYDHARHAIFHYEDGSDDDRRTRRSVRGHSTEPHSSYKYKVEGRKATKLEPEFPYEDHPPMPRRYSAHSSKMPPETGREPPLPRDASYYSYFPKVKEAKSYTPDDVSFTSVQYTAVPHHSESAWA